MAYEGTDVAPEKSQAQIKKLLMSHGGSEMTTASRFDPPMEGFQAKLILDGKPYLMRLTVPIRVKANAKAQDQEVRRVWRVLYHHMKSVFEAADSGVIELREMILPFLVTESGRTVGKIILDDLDKKLIAPVRGLLE